MNIGKWGGTLVAPAEGEVWVGALDEDQFLIEILGGKDDVRFTVSLEALDAVIKSLEMAIRDKEDKLYIADTH